MEGSGGEESSLLQSRGCDESDTTWQLNGSLTYLGRLCPPPTPANLGDLSIGDEFPLLSLGSIYLWSHYYV